MNILVMGSLELPNPKASEFLKFFANEISDNGHKLLNGCRNQLDKVLAENVFNRLTEKGADTNGRIISYVEPGSEAIHQLGTVLHSRITSWSSLASNGLEVPETIQNADVVFVIGGKEGTNCAANWARIGNKPLLPITIFGGAASDVFEYELQRFDTKYGSKVGKMEYEILNQITSDYTKISKEVMALAARMIYSNKVFVIMSFSGDSQLEDAYDTIETICKENGYEALKVSDANQTDRIVSQIFTRIGQSAFVIADVSEPKANVYYELGYAHGQKKDVILTAKKDTQLPFDLADFPTIFWDSQKSLKTNLRNKIQLLAAKQGRKQ